MSSKVIQALGPGGLILLSLSQANAAPLPPASIPKFQITLEKPPEYVPTVVNEGGVAVRHDYRVTVLQTTAKMLPGDLPPTPVLAYRGLATRGGPADAFEFEGSPGATFDVTRGIPARVEWVNAITGAHLLTIDPSLHWANPGNPPDSDVQSPVPHVTHLHGLEVASRFDGHPEAWFTAGGLTGPSFVSNVYDYPNSQPATTLWYHDHTLGITRLNVYAGLAGMYLIRDPLNSIENPSDGVAVLPDEAHEMPLVIQDKSFNDDGTLVYPAAWAPVFTGNTNVVNGKVWPRMEVERTTYRFRMVNASNHRFYRFGLSNGANLTVIGSDGGFLEAPARVGSLLLAPGERADVLIDFSSVPAGGSVVLTNNVTPFNTGTLPSTNASFEVLRFEVPAGAADPANLPALAPLPAVLNTIPELTPTPDVDRRTLTLHLPPAGGNISLMDGQTWHSDASELPRVGTTEEWDLVNLTGNSHSMHLHLIQFQIVGRQDIDTASYQAEWNRLNGTTLPLTQPTEKVAVEGFMRSPSFRAPDAVEAGWKDTLITPGNSVTRIRVRWAPQEPEETPTPGVNPFPFDPTDPTDPGYVWHCHLLEHEDNEMMRPIIVVN